MNAKQLQAIADGMLTAADIAANDAAKIGMKDLPPESFNAICSQYGGEEIKGRLEEVIQKRVALTIATYNDIPKNRAEIAEYAKHTTDLYRDAVSVLMQANDMPVDGESAGQALTAYYYKTMADMTLLTAGLDKAGISLEELTPNTIDVPTLEGVCKQAGISHGVPL